MPTLIFLPPRTVGVYIGTGPLGQRPAHGPQLLLPGKRETGLKQGQPLGDLHPWHHVKILSLPMKRIPRAAR